jgi:hypothetical protein
MRTLLALAAGLVLAQANPKGEELTLKCLALPKPGRNLKLQGTVALPDGAPVKIILSATEEQVYYSERIRIKLARTSMPVGTVRVPVKDGKFVYEGPAAGPGIYDIVALRQGVAATAEGGRGGQWRQTLYLWDEKDIERLAEGLVTVEGYVKDCRALLKQFEKAIPKETSWNAAAKQLARNLKDQLDQLKKADRSLYSGALNELAGHMDTLNGTMQSFKFVNGEFKSAEDYYGEKEDNRASKFSIQNLVKYMDEVEVVAGREFCLWMIKEFRRSADTKLINAELEKQTRAKHPRITPYADRLKKLKNMTPEDIAYLEKQLRGDEP